MRVPFGRRLTVCREGGIFLGCRQSLRSPRIGTEALSLWRRHVAPARRVSTIRSAQAIRGTHELDWHPARFLVNAAAMI